MTTLTEKPSKDSETIHGLEANAATADVSDEPPDGGLRAWMCVIGGYVLSFLLRAGPGPHSVHYDRWLVCFSTFGYASSFGVYQDLYTLAGASSASNVSWIGSIQLSLMYMPGLLSGKLLDDGYFHHVCICGSVIYVFS